eukprot:Pgem_evm1s10547
MSLKIAAFDLQDDNVTLEWAPRDLYKLFRIEMKEGEEWRDLSNTFKSTFLKKKNLVAGLSPTLTLTLIPPR